MQILTTIATVLCGMVLAASAVTDAAYRKIPNLITLPAIAVGLVMTAIGDWGAFFISLAAICVVFLVGASGIFGSGDLKLIMAVTALCGVLPMLWSVGIASCAVLLVEVIRSPKQAFATIRDGLQLMFRGGQADTQGRRIPFAPYLLFGFLVWLALSLLVL